MSWPWSQLGLSGPSDLSEVRRAYAEKLKTTHPEDDPEGFQRLHSAYQLASRMARQNRRKARPAPAEQKEPPKVEREKKEFDYDQLLQEGSESPRLSREQEKEEDFDFDQLLREGSESPRLSREQEKEGDFDFDQLLREGSEPPRLSREQEKEEDFDFDQLLQEKGECPHSLREEEGGEQDFDFERLIAEGEAERAEARRRRGEARRRSQEQKRQERLRQEQARRNAYEQERRSRFDQEQFRWQNTETILHTIEMLYNAQADREAWEKFFQSPLFQQTKGSLDLIFGLEDFVSAKSLSQEVRLALFLAYGFDKGPSRPELRPLYQMLLSAWQAARSKKKKEWLLNILAVPITLGLIYVAAVILMSPLLIVFILLGLLAIHGLNKGWLRRRPKNLARGQRSSFYVLCFLAGCVIAVAFLLPGLWESARELTVAGDPRARVCLYLEEDYGVKFRSLYTGNSPRFDNVFAPEDSHTQFFLAGPDGERDEKNGKLGYTTNYPEMMVLWQLEKFARDRGITGVKELDQELEPWETNGIFLVTLPFYGAEDTITALGELLEELAQEDWYQPRTPAYEIVLCSRRMEEGWVILTRWKPTDGPFNAEAVCTLYETDFAHAYCAQLLQEEELDRDFIHGGEEHYTLTDGGMAELKGQECRRLYGLDAGGQVRMEYYISVEGGNIYCVPGGFWDGVGTEEDIQFYRLLHRDATGGMLQLFYPWITPY